MSDHEAWLYERGWWYSPSLLCGLGGWCKRGTAYVVCSSRQAYEAQRTWDRADVKAKAEP